MMVTGEQYIHSCPYSDPVESFWRNCKGQQTMTGKSGLYEVPWEGQENVICSWWGSFPLQVLTALEFGHVASMNQALQL